MTGRELWAKVLAILDEADWQKQPEPEPVPSWAQARAEAKTDGGTNLVDLTDDQLRTLAGQDGARAAQAEKTLAARERSRHFAMDLTALSDDQLRIVGMGQDDRAQQARKILEAREGARKVVKQEGREQEAQQEPEQATDHGLTARTLRAIAQADKETANADMLLRVYRGRHIGSAWEQDAMTDDQLRAEARRLGERGARATQELAKREQIARLRPEQSVQITLEAARMLQGSRVDPARAYRAWQAYNAHRALGERAETFEEWLQGALGLGE